MKINSYNNYNLQYKPVFCSNTRWYKNDGKDISTMTSLFRDDLDWSEFTDYISSHFSDKDKVNVVQFAASDGAEAYSLIISLLEKYPKLVDKFTPIEAYDIDSEIIRAANSGLINLLTDDIANASKYIHNIGKYFKHSKEKLIIKDDEMEDLRDDEIGLHSYATYQVNKVLTKGVNFHEGDMFNVISTLEDNSDTILMCRNILGYLDPEKANAFVDLASERLKKGSLFIIGEYDSITTDLEGYILQKGFRKVMNNVYEKISNNTNLYLNIK